MVVIKRLAGWFLLLSLAMPLLGGGEFSLAQVLPGMEDLGGFGLGVAGPCCRRCNNCPGHYFCPPNVRNYGYYQTAWRTWPGEVRRDQTFPQSLGVEPLPTPEGTKPEPLPKGTLAPPPQEGGGFLQPGLEPYIEGTERPPQQGLPFQPETPGPMEPEGGTQETPGLPLENLVPPREEEGQPSESPLDNLFPGSQPSPEPNEGGETRPPRKSEKAVSTVATSLPRNDQAVEPAGFVEVEVRPHDPAYDNPPGTAEAASPGASLALEGYCPVELIEREKWVTGKPYWKINHQGRIFQFAGSTQRERFLANPLRYLPAHAGCDPVVAREEGRQVPGLIDFCVVYEGRLYMFSSQDTLARFRETPSRYVQTPPR